MITYFSATGNSKYVADRISEKLQIKTESLSMLNSEIPLLVKVFLDIMGTKRYNRFCGEGTDHLLQMDKKSAASIIYILYI